MPPVAAAAPYVQAFEMSMPVWCQLTGTCWAIDSSFSINTPVAPTTIESQNSVLFRKGALSVRPTEFMRNGAVIRCHSSSPIVLTTVATPCRNEPCWACFVADGASGTCAVGVAGAGACCPTVVMAITVATTDARNMLLAPRINRLVLLSRTMAEAKSWLSMSPSPHVAAFVNTARISSSRRPISTREIAEPGAFYRYLRIVRCDRVPVTYATDCRVEPGKNQWWEGPCVPYRRSSPLGARHQTLRNQGAADRQETETRPVRHRAARRCR